MAEAAIKMHQLELQKNEATVSAAVAIPIYNFSKSVSFSKSETKMTHHIKNCVPEHTVIYLNDK